MKIILIYATVLLTNPLLAEANECMSPGAFAERLHDGEEHNGSWKFPSCAENEHIATARELAEIAMCWGAKGIEEKPEDFEAYEARRLKDFWGYGEYRTALDVENEGIFPPKNFDKFIYSMEGYVPPKREKDIVVLAQSSDRQKGYDVAFNPYYNGYIYLFGWRSLMPRRQALCLPNRDGVQYKKADVIPTPPNYFAGCSSTNKEIETLKQNSSSTYNNFLSCFMKEFPISVPACLKIKKCESRSYQKELNNFDKQSQDCAPTATYEQTAKLIQKYIDETKKIERLYESLHGSLNCGE